MISRMYTISYGILIKCRTKLLVRLVKKNESPGKVKTDLDNNGTNFNKTIIMKLGYKGFLINEESIGC